MNLARELVPWVSKSAETELKFRTLVKRDARE